MRSRLAGALVALFVLASAPAPAVAQDLSDERQEAVDEVLRDYRDDGVIDACDHTRRALRDTLEQLPPEADIETPDLRPALEAGIEQIKDDECREEEPEETPTPSPTPAPTAAPTTTPAPTAAPPDTGGDDDLGSLGPLPGSDDGGSGSTGRPGAGDVSPLDPEVTPVPPATTPAPAAPPPAAAEPSGAPPAPVYANADDGVPVPLLVLAGVLALLALLALLYAALSRLGWGERRLAGARRAWSEAAYRAGGTWGDFADWLRVGR